MTKTSRGLVEYASAQLGRPYWYGTFGNTATNDLLAMKKGQYPAHYQQARMQKYKSQLGERVHDCVGLIKGYLWSCSPDSKPVYNSSQDVSANGMLLKCKERGRIYTLPEIPGILVFMPGHVGIYIGGGRVIEARGFNYGVGLNIRRHQGILQNAIRMKPQSLMHSNQSAKTVPMPPEKQLPRQTELRIIRVRRSRIFRFSLFSNKANSLSPKEPMWHKNPK